MAFSAIGDRTGGIRKTLKLKGAEPPAVRLEYVDIFRGTAILIMIFIEIFDFLSKKSIYTDVPWYAPQINSVTWIPPIWLFTMVAGMSVFLLIEKYNNLKQKSSILSHINSGTESLAQICSLPKKEQIWEDFCNKWKIIWLIGKRYLPYVLISLPFTIVLWGLPTYIRWEEAIQGIGLCAVFAAIILSFKPKTKYLLAAVFAFILLHIGLNSIALGIPRVPSGIEIIPAVAVNALWRGWFSVSNLLPFMLAGAVCLNFLRKNKLKKLVLFGLVFLAISLLLHFTGFKIDFYGRSAGHFFFGVGQSALIMGFVFWLWQRIKTGVWNVIGNFGQAAIVAYLGHYLLIGLPAKKFGIILPDIWALILTLVLIVGIYGVCILYLQLKRKIKTRKLTTTS